MSELYDVRTHRFETKMPSKATSYNRAHKLGFVVRVYCTVLYMCVYSGCWHWLCTLSTVARGYKNLVRRSQLCLLPQLTPADRRQRPSSRDLTEHCTTVRTVYTTCHVAVAWNLVEFWDKRWAQVPCRSPFIDISYYQCFILIWFYLAMEVLGKATLYHTFWAICGPTTSLSTITHRAIIDAPSVTARHVMYDTLFSCTVP